MKKDIITQLDTKQLIKELWSLWDSMAECGELHIGPKFSKQYEELKKRVDKATEKKKNDLPSKPGCW